MITYAKLSELGQLDVLKFIPHTANPSEARLAAYATENGYKPVSTISIPGIYYIETWEETDTEIHNVWIPQDLDIAKNDALNRVQQELTSKLNTPERLHCDSLGFDIVYDNDAITNLLGGLQGIETFTDADDIEHPCTPELIAAVSATVINYRTSLYNIKRYRVELIKNAINVDAVETAITAEPNQD